MSSPVEPPHRPIACGEATRRHLRGSNLLLLGRVISLGINLLVNVLLVRHLTKGDYGAFAYGLAIAAFGANLILMGMPRAVARFAALHHENADHGAMFGSLILSASLVAGLGVTGLVVLFACREPLAAHWAAEPLVMKLTMTLVVLAPIHALESLFEGMLAVFSDSGALFLRRCILGPLLRLAAVAAVVLCSGSISVLAAAYLGASLASLLLCALLLLRTLRAAGLLRHLTLASLRFRPRELLRYGLPLVAADVMLSIRAPLAIVLLEILRDTREIADLNAFLKISGLNLIVLQSVRQMFLPVVTRMLARGEHDSIDDIYWQTTIWVSLLTFPIFAPCLVMPEALALLVNGPGYVASSGVLVVLALGDYFNAVLGPNTNTLHVYARVRFTVWTTSVATLCGSLLAWLLAPAHGALGAAAGLSASLVLQNVLQQWGLHRYTAVGAIRRKHLEVYASQAIALALLMALDAWIELPLVAGGLVVIGVTLGLLRLHRATMNLAGVLPEVARIPLLGRLLLPAATRPRELGTALAREQAPPP